MVAFTNYNYRGINMEYSETLRQIDIRLGRIEDMLYKINEDIGKTKAEIKNCVNYKEFIITLLPILGGILLTWVK